MVNLSAGGAALRERSQQDAAVDEHNDPGVADSPVHKVLHERQQGLQLKKVYVLPVLEAIAEEDLPIDSTCEGGGERAGVT